MAGSAFFVGKGTHMKGTPARRVLPVAGASSGAAWEFGCKCWVEWPLPGDG